jgi:hypothetical protein
MSPNAHHLVAAALKLVWNCLNRHAEALAAELVSDPVHKGRARPTQGKQWKDANLVGHAAHLANRGAMKCFAQLRRVQEQKM